MEASSLQGRVLEAQSFLTQHSRPPLRTLKAVATAVAKAVAGEGITQTIKDNSWSQEQRYRFLMVADTGRLGTALCLDATLL